MDVYYIYIFCTGIGNYPNKSLSFVLRFDLRGLSVAFSQFAEAFSRSFAVAEARRSATILDVLATLGDLHSEVPFNRDLVREEVLHCLSLDFDFGFSVLLVTESACLLDRMPCLGLELFFSPAFCFEARMLIEVEDSGDTEFKPLPLLMRSL